MATIALIACASKKRTYRAPARDLYASPLFQYALAYAQTLQPDQIYILSARYGLVQLDEEIEPYNLTLKRMTVQERKTWAEGVIAALRQQCDLAHDHFVVLAGTLYREYVLPHLPSYELPLQGYPIGKQLQWLKQNVMPT